MAHVCIITTITTSAAAYKLQTTLESDGYAVWMHPVPEQALDHAAWLESELRGSWALLALVTPATHTDPALLYQVAYALGAAIPVIPLTVDAPDLLPPLVARDPVPLVEQATWQARLRDIATAASTRAIPLPVDAPVAIKEARQLLDSPLPEMRAEGITHLAEHDHPTACTLLIAALAHPVYADVRGAAAAALGQTYRSDTNADIVPALVRTLGDEVEAVTHAAITALVTTGANAIPALHTAITGPDRWRRNGALLALTRITDGDTIPALIDALNIPHWYSSRAAAARLALIGDERAIPALQAALKRDDPHLQRLAEQALNAVAQ